MLLDSLERERKKIGQEARRRRREKEENEEEEETCNVEGARVEYCPLLADRRVSLFLLFKLRWICNLHLLQLSSISLESKDPFATRKTIHCPFVHQSPASSATVPFPPLPHCPARSGAIPLGSFQTQGQGPTKTERNSLFFPLNFHQPALVGEHVATPIPSFKSNQRSLGAPEREDF